jgi:cytochrome c peroxidase
VLGGALALLLGRGSGDARSISWTPKERRAIRGLSLAALPAVPRDPSNRVAEDGRAAELGHRLFFDRGFSANGRVSCSSCHMPERGLQDDRPRGRGLGLTPRRTMPLAGVAYARWLFWDGRRDSLWAQALTPLESEAEHGITRTFAARRIASRYRRAYEAVFGPLPSGVIGGSAPRRPIDLVFANMGKAIAAYERTLRPAPATFDRFAAALARHDDHAAARQLSPAAARGLRLFVGRGRCTSCHFGPLFTNGEFHNTGVPQDPARPDRGRAAGVTQVVRDPFNCLGPFSDAKPEQCAALRFLVTGGPQLAGEFKVPSLRDVASRPPYTHAGRFRTLRQVLEHYRRAPRAQVGRSEVHPLALDDAELDELEAFLRTLDGGVAAPKGFLRPPRPR